MTSPYTVSRMSRSTVVRGAVALAACALLLVGCGGADETNEGARPTVAQIKEGVAAEFNGSPDAAQLRSALGPQFDTWLDQFSSCVAQSVHDDAGFPNGVLRAIQEGREASVDAGNEATYTDRLTRISETCAETTTQSLISGS